MFDGILSNAGQSGWLVVTMALLVYAVVCALHFRQRGRHRRTSALIQYGFWLYFLFISILIVLPLPDVTPDFCDVYSAAGTPQIMPFDFVHDIARASGYYRQFSLRALLGSHAFVLAVLNFILFAPLGIYLRVFTRHSIPVSVLIAFACTLAFEITQGTGLFGLYPCPYRHFNVDDLLLNTLGAILGMLIVSMRNAHIYHLTRPYRP